MMIQRAIMHVPNSRKTTKTKWNSSRDTLCTQRPKHLSSVTPCSIKGFPLTLYVSIRLLSAVSQLSFTPVWPTCLQCICVCVCTAVGCPDRVRSLQALRSQRRMASLWAETHTHTYTGQTHPFIFRFKWWLHSLEVCVCVCLYSGTVPTAVPWKKTEIPPHASHRLSSLSYHLTALNNSPFIKNWND